jgi:hypothetical protein
MCGAGTNKRARLVAQRGSSYSSFAGMPVIAHIADRVNRTKESRRCGGHIFETVRSLVPTLMIRYRIGRRWNLTRIGGVLQRELARYLSGRPAAPDGPL